MNPSKPKATTFQMPSYLEFFAGGGMVRAALGQQWECLFANDFDPSKRKIYEANWRHAPNGKDIAHVSLADLPEDSPAGFGKRLPARADLAWASFPCQDLSQAGFQLGLNGKRSGCFYPFWDLMKALIAVGRGPRVIAIENVYGAVTHHDQETLTTIASAFAEVNYKFGFLVMDAVEFVPQSRPRFFAIGICPEMSVPPQMIAQSSSQLWHPKRLTEAVEKFSPETKRHWVWWNVPAPTSKTKTLADLIEDEPTGVDWHSREETRRLLSLMNVNNRGKVRAAVARSRETRHPQIGTVYRRTRTEGGVKQQRAEVRFDGVAGCLRTPRGGSSRQTILVVDNKGVRSRLLSPREAVRLMGLPDSFKLPDNYNEAYHFAGDGVVVPVVRHLRDHLFLPLLRANPVHVRKTGLLSA